MYRSRGVLNYDAYSIMGKTSMHIFIKRWIKAEIMNGENIFTINRSVVLTRFPCRIVGTWSGRKNRRGENDEGKKKSISHSVLRWNGKMYNPWYIQLTYYKFISFFLRWSRARKKRKKKVIQKQLVLQIVGQFFLAFLLRFLLLLFFMNPICAFR